MTTALIETTVPESDPARAGVGCAIARLLSGATARRSFWCALTRREVEFQARGLPGVRRLVAVKGCSVFDPPEAVACARHCLDATFRRQWEPPLPVRR